MPPYVRRRSALAVVIAAGLPLAGCKITPTEEAPTPAPRVAPKAAPVGAAPAAVAPAPAATAVPVPAEAPVTAPASPAASAVSGGSGAPLIADPPADLLAAGAPSPSSAEYVAEVQARVDALRAWLQRTQRAAVLVSEPADYAWLTLGASGDLGPGRPAACLAVLPDRVLILAPSDGIDAARAPLRALGWSARTYRWDLGRDNGAPVRVVAAMESGAAIGADTHRPGTDFVADDLTELRRRLTGHDETRLRWLAAQTAETIATAIGQTKDSETEAKLAARLVAALAEKGIAAASLRVTALERLAGDGFGVPGDTSLASGAAVQVVATRWGLQATVGRTLTPQPQPAAAEDFVVARRVYATLLSRVASGASLRDIYRAGEQAAVAAGVGEAWRDEAVGGLGAYQPADEPLSPDSVATLGAGDVLTLSLRLPHAYLADTLIVGESGAVLASAAKDWPSPTFLINGRPVPLPTLRFGELAVAEAEGRRVAAEARLHAGQFLAKVLGGAVAEARGTLPKKAEAKAEPAANAAPAKTEDGKAAPGANAAPAVNSAPAKAEATTDVKPPVAP
jgi:hypothetical protein